MIEGLLLGGAVDTLGFAAVVDAVGSFVAGAVGTVGSFVAGAAVGRSLISFRHDESI